MGSVSWKVALGAGDHALCDCVTVRMMILVRL